MLVDQSTNKQYIWYTLGTTTTSVPYTSDYVARFLGLVGKDGKEIESFKAMFGALELKAEGWL